jgi:hypothetical protein
LSENVHVAPNILTTRHGRPHLFKAENVFAVFSAVEFVEVFLVDIQCRTIALPVTGGLIIRKRKESDKDAPFGGISRFNFEEFRLLLTPIQPLGALVLPTRILFIALGQVLKYR